MGKNENGVLRLKSSTIMHICTLLFLQKCYIISKATVSEFKALSVNISST